jgi:tetratricopeptide (TPR) repeat protein
LAEAHAALGYVSQYDWKWREAEREYHRALELNPALAPARSWYSNLLIARGRAAESVIEARRAVDMDPLSAPVRSTLVFVLIVAARGQEAIAEAHKGLEISPDYPFLQLRLGWAHVSIGQYAKGIEALEKKAISTRRSLAFLDLLGEAYALSGQRRKAAEILQELEAAAGRRYVSSIRGLYTCLALRDWDRAFAVLEKGFREHANYICYLRVVPLPHMYPEFRATPRFKRLMARLNIPDRF